MKAESDQILLFLISLPLPTYIIKSIKISYFFHIKCKNDWLFLLLSQQQFTQDECYMFEDIQIFFHEDVDYNQYVCESSISTILLEDKFLEDKYFSNKFLHNNEPTIPNH